MNSGSDATSTRMWSTILDHVFPEDTMLIKFGDVKRNDIIQIELPLRKIKPRSGMLATVWRWKVDQKQPLVFEDVTLSGPMGYAMANYLMGDSKAFDDRINASQLQRADVEEIAKYYDLLVILNYMKTKQADFASPLSFQTCKYCGIHFLPSDGPLCSRSTVGPTGQCIRCHSYMSHCRCQHILCRHIKVDLPWPPILSEEMGEEEPEMRTVDDSCGVSCREQCIPT